MRRLGNKLRWGLALGFLLLVLIGAWAYFIGTRAVLRQAEAFAFRRMVVPQLAGQGTFRFFWATNRVPADLAGPVDDRFGRERGDALTYGHFDTRIEPSLGLGMIIDASDWFLNEEIRLLQVSTLDSESILDKLHGQVRASRHRSLLLVVHGFREAFPSALRKTAFLAHVLDIDTPVLVFDWPGNQGSSLRGYRRARRVAQNSGAELARLMQAIVSQVRPDRLWLLANSMGAEVVVEAFSQLHGDEAFADASTEIEEVVLTAPDVGHELFNQEFKQDILDMADRVTVYVSSNDRALLASRLINRSTRLGESTLDPSNPGQVKQAESFAALLGPGQGRLSLVDVTPVNRTRNFHNFSLETPEFFNDLFLRLILKDLPETRELYFLETPEGARYFVLTRGR